MGLRQVVKPIVPGPVLRWYQARGLLAHKGRRVWRGEAGGEPEMRLLPALCDPRKTSVDVGANEGGYAWHMRRLSRRLHVFEPLPDLAQRLSSGFALDRRVCVHHVALSDHAGMIELRVPMELGELNTGLATIEAANGLSGGEIHGFTVSRRTLDSYRLRDVGFVKIDVEGHELAVLHGAAALIATCHPAFLIEAQEIHRPGALASINALLSAAGYHGLFLLDGILHDIAAFDPAVHQADDALDGALQRRPGRIFINNFIFVIDAEAFRRRAVKSAPTVTYFQVNISLLFP